MSIRDFWNAQVVAFGGTGDITNRNDFEDTLPAAITAKFAAMNGGALTAGSGVSAAEHNKSNVTLDGGLYTTRIVLDLTGLASSTTDLDIIGNPAGAANAHIGQITAAVSGAIIGGRVTCLELPAGGVTDIDLYSATVGTGAQDGGIAALVETALITAGGAWTNGATKGLIAVPAADEYLYLVGGAAGTAGTYTAGKFLIELFGV